MTKFRGYTAFKEFASLLIGVIFPGVVLMGHIYYPVKNQHPKKILGGV